MNKRKNPKSLDELISRTIGGKVLEFDCDNWKQQHPAEVRQFEAKTQRHSTHNRPAIDIWRTITKSRITKLATAAVIIIGAGVFLFHHGKTGSRNRGQISEATKSRAGTLTFMSLSLAYRQGGIEAVEKQCDEAYKFLGSPGVSPSATELVRELNGS